MKPYYEDSWATIYHGDCREIVGGLSGVGLVVADPPYGVKLSRTASRMNRIGGRVHGDDAPFDPP